MEGLEFQRRPKDEKYQVRFWSTPNLYGSFVDACEKEGLVMQDVFNDFLLWFTEKHYHGLLPVRDVQPKESL